MRQRLVTLAAALLCAALISLARPSLAQTTTAGTTVDDFQLASGFEATGKAAAVDSHGNVYTVGTGRASATEGRWVVRKSTDGGNTFATVMTYRYGVNGNQANAVAVDALDNVYVAGQGADSKGYLRWLVCKSSDGGATWRVVDDHTLGRDTWPNGICASASGAIYVVGIGSQWVKGGNDTYWLVRRSTDAGATWTTVDKFLSQPAGKNSTSAYAVAEDVNGNLYVAGLARDSANLIHSIVRRGTANGTSWTTIDDFQYLSGKPFQPTSVAVDNASGSVYVTGYARDASYMPHAILRKGSTATGGGFATISDYQHEPGQYTSANAVVIGPSGELVQALQASLSTGGGLWLIRASYDGGATFSVLDEFQYVPGKGGTPNGLVTAGTSLFAIGYAGDGVTNHWITRKY